MKRSAILVCSFFFFLGIIAVSCDQKSKNEPVKNDEIRSHEAVVLKDYGAEPTVLDIDAYTMTNTDFRTALWTGEKLQVTLMSIPVGGDVGLEQHLHTEQFLRIEDGTARIVMGDNKDALDYTKTAGKDFAIFIPAGKWHNIMNTGDKPLKLYSIYSPVEHPHGAVHKTQKDAMEAEHMHNTMHDGGKEMEHRR